jgi:ankyrin repeat protein
MLFAARGQGRAVTLLLEAGADPNEVTPSGHTALMLACIHGRAGVVRALLAAGADPRRRTRKGYLAIEHAVEYAQRHVLKVLLEMGTGGPSLLPSGMERRAREVLLPLTRQRPSQAGRFSIGGWLMRRTFAAARQRTTHGVTVGVLLYGGRETDGLHALVARALELLAERDPKRLGRLRESVLGILVFPWARGAAGYDPDTKICVLTPKELTAEGRTPSTLAATLAHEATHARLSKLGFGYATRPERIRIERACYRAELALAERLDERAMLEQLIQEAMLRVPAYYSRRRGILAWLLGKVARSETWAKMWGRNR